MVLLCATGGRGAEFAKPPLPLALTPGATDGRSVFMGFDFDAPVDWDGDPHAECGGLFRCFRLETPWHGFDRALAVGDVATGSVWTLEFSRDFQPLYHGLDRESARRLAEDLARELGEECGIPLSPGKIYGSQDTAYMGQAGAFRAILGFWWYPWEPPGQLTEESRAFGCRFLVERIPVRIPSLSDGPNIQ